MKPIAIVPIWMALVGAAVAQDQQLGARTKGMGGSYTAFEDDPVSIWLNPAGIATQPNQMALSYQTYTAYPRDKSRGPNDTTVFSVEAETVVADPVFWPSFLGFVFQLGDPETPFAAGICIARPYHLNYAMDRVADPQQTVFVPEAEVEQSIWRLRATIATDLRFRAPEDPGFLTHVSAGVGADLAFTQWEFSGVPEEESETSAAGAFGLGVLLGVYDNLDSFKLNFGLAYQSAAEFDFDVDPDLLPAFDMPQQVNAGLTFYLLDGQKLRITVDLQWIDWSETAEAPLISRHDGFEDAINASLGVEYRVPVNDRVSLYPRAGVRRFDAPWGDEDDLPMTGAFKLVLDTDGDTFNIFTLGLGLGWLNEAGAFKSLDLGVDFGGDAFNAALGYTWEF